MPQCGTDQVIVYEKHAVMQTHTSIIATASRPTVTMQRRVVLECDWVGQRKDLGEQS